MASTPGSLPEYEVRGFPAPGLRQIVRHITGNTDDGHSSFLESNSGEHYRVMAENWEVTNIIYSMPETPVDLNDNKDVKLAQQEEVLSLYLSAGPMTIDYDIVVEGVFELSLDSGEKRILRAGETHRGCEKRATKHKWKNIHGNGTLPSRIVFFLLDCKEVVVGGNRVQGDLGDLKKKYTGRGTY
ncbi:hypothetical protein T440DRAFT_409604 [Plenodomus tracheiphilus IPT5]|uniref:Uncharacterized protein n=1 Tax=Plenodomus tracheiphilus IPT5 TaxID=1408161 RepID=A0A6A7APQ2_9PLEO|nr:hypothetical protein T440DRAFT_409604 [Plenodomus tracheiphilus IPT5]